MSPIPTSNAFRVERDLLGERRVPTEVYWGIHTLRAIENFPITNERLSSNRHLIQGLAAVKCAAVRSNIDLGLLDPERGSAIDSACMEILNGELHDQFPVDAIQGGAGTSTNMAMNEVIANRALELQGRLKGSYSWISPNDHVNLSQSTNDVYPTAVKLSTIYGIAEVHNALEGLEQAFVEKSSEFRNVIKMGRTQLQDAVPMTLGQEFGAFAATISKDRKRLMAAEALLHEINLGATAIGTGLNAPQGYSNSVRLHLEDLTGLKLATSVDLIEATQDVGAFVHLSGVLKRVAVKLSKICNDLRLLASGPRVGLNEITLPAVQSGSSMMPGKINPVIPEVVNQVAYEVIGNDVAITLAAEGGQLQLNAFEPLIAHSLHKNLSHISAACRTLTERCVRGIAANPDHTRSTTERSIGLVTALNPHIGYAAASVIAKEALESGHGVAELVVKHGLLHADELETLLQPERLANLTHSNPAH